LPSRFQIGAPDRFPERDGLAGISSLDTGYAGQILLPQGLQKEHRLVAAGPYARIRHLLYTSLFGIGIALVPVTASWLLVILALSLAVGRAARVPREEKMLIAVYGEEYPD